MAGAKAQFKGAGSINGMEGFGFMLTAVDGAITGNGSVDRFRIKIWQRVSGEIVYDNQPGTSDTEDPVAALEGGSFVIHNK